jgi:hypothetical protein
MIDHAHIDHIHHKEDLIQYLEEKDCPELKKMEAELMKSKLTLA